MPPLQGDVCRPCNIRLGDEVDLPFARTGPNAFFRWRAGIHGKRKSNKKGTRSPYEEGVRDVPPLTMLGRVAGEAYDILWESHFGTHDVEPMSQIVFEDDDGRKIPVPVFRWMYEQPESIRKALQASGARDPKPFTAFASIEEQPRLEALIARLGYSMHTSWSQELLPQQQVRLAVGAPVDHGYTRGVAKLAFHYVLAVFGDLAGADSEFADIRSHIWEGGEPAPGLVTQETEQVVFQLRQGMRPTHWSHLVAASRENRLITAHVQLFAGPDHLPLPFRVRIGRDPSPLWRLPERHAHHFVIDHPDTPPRFDGRVEDLQPIERIVLPY